MKLTPPNGCILAAYFENELIFTIAQKWTAKDTLERAICENTSFEYANVVEPAQDMEVDDDRFEIYFHAAYDATGPVEKYVLELVPITLY